MLLITKESIMAMKNEYGNSNMKVCFAIARGMSAISEQAILLIDTEKLMVLFINKITNNVIQKIEFEISEISEQRTKVDL